MYITSHCNCLCRPPYVQITPTSTSEMKERRMVRSLPGLPEASCSGKPPTILDIEGGIKDEKKSLGTRTLERLSLRIFSWGYPVQRVLRHFPVTPLFSLMFSSLYPNVTLPVRIGITISLNLTISSMCTREIVAFNREDSAKSSKLKSEQKF